MGMSTPTLSPGNIIQVIYPFNIERDCFVVLYNRQIPFSVAMMLA